MPVPLITAPLTTAPLTTAPRPLRRTGRRPLAAALAVLPLALVTACGGSSASESAASGSTASGSGDATATRTVETAFGSVEVPEEPQRVVALGDTALDTALALGVTPVGTLSSRGGTTVSDYLADQAGDVPIVGTVTEPNLEAVVEAAPDLIVASSSTDQTRYDALSAIAPTVVPEVSGFGDWLTETRTVAEALGMEAEAEELLTGIGTRSQEIAGGLDAAGTAAVVRWMPNGPVVMSGALMSSRLVEATGDTLVPAAGFADRPHTDPLSLENLSEVDAEFLYVATLNADGEAALQAARSHPAFAQLQAARTDRVAAVDGGYWSSAAGPIAAGKVLDDIERLRAQG